MLYKVLLGMISKKMIKSYSVFCIEQKTEFEKYNCLFVDSLRYSFGRIFRPFLKKSIHQICFLYSLTGFYMIGDFTERYFLTEYCYILENHFYFVNVPDYCFEPSLSRIYCVNSFVKVCEGPSTYLFLISLLCILIINIKKKK